MKLSEAMHANTHTFPKASLAFVRYVEQYEEEEERYEVCALGAAAYTYYPVIEDLAGFSEKRIQQILQEGCGVNLTTTCVTYPVDGMNVSLLRAITALNDFHGWSIDQIADWVEAQGY